MRLSARLEEASVAGRAPPLRRAVLALIGLYQRRISPIKGFRCAHRALHGGPSCSDYIKTAIATQGVLAGFRLVSTRFVACHAASRELHVMMAAAGSKDAPEGKRDESAQERARRCAVFTPATCCLTGFIFH